MPTDATLRVHPDGAAAVCDELLSALEVNGNAIEADVSISVNERSEATPRFTVPVTFKTHVTVTADDASEATAQAEDAVADLTVDDLKLIKTGVPSRVYP